MSANVSHILGHPFLEGTIMSRGHRRLPFGHGQAMRVMTSSHINTGRRECFIFLDEVLYFLGILAASRASGGSRPRVIANGAIAQDRIERGSRLNQCSRLPWQHVAGIRGTWSVARPVLPAHQLAATAMAKANGAVYSASPCEG